MLTKHIMKIKSAYNSIVTKIDQLLERIGNDLNNHFTCEDIALFPNSNFFLLLKNFIHRYSVL